MALNETAAEKFKFWLKEAPSLPPRVRKAGDELLEETQTIYDENEQLKRVVGSIEAVLDGKASGYFDNTMVVEEIKLIMGTLNKGVVDA